MSRHINSEIIEQIVDIIYNWEGKLTWPAIVEAVHRRLNVKYSRQTLSKFESIKEAYYQKKDQLDSDSFEPQYYNPSYVKKVLEKIEKLERENEQLKKALDQQNQQQARWIYNAIRKGLSEADLEAPMPPSNRK